MLKIAPRTLCRLRCYGASCHAIERGRESPQRPDNHCSAGKNQQPHLPDGQIRDRHSSGGGGRQHEHAGPGRAYSECIAKESRTDGDHDDHRDGDRRKMPGPHAEANDNPEGQYDSRENQRPVQIRPISGIKGGEGSGLWIAPAWEGDTRPSRSVRVSHEPSGLPRVIMRRKAANSPILRHGAASRPRRDVGAPWLDVSTTVGSARYDLFRGDGSLVHPHL